MLCTAGRRQKKKSRRSADNSHARLPLRRLSKAAVSLCPERR